MVQICLKEKEIIDSEPKNKTNLTSNLTEQKKCVAQSIHLNPKINEIYTQQNIFRDILLTIQQNFISQYDTEDEKRQAKLNNISCQSDISISILSHLRNKEEEMSENNIKCLEESKVKSNSNKQTDLSKKNQNI